MNRQLYPIHLAVTKHRLRRTIPFVAPSGQSSTHITDIFWGASYECRVDSLKRIIIEMDVNWGRSFEL